MNGRFRITSYNVCYTKLLRAVIINSPHNPTGKIYSEDNLRALFDVLKAAERRTGRSIYLICDEPYRKITYDNAVVPAVFPHYKNSIVVTSFSKDLSIPGERIGYAAVNPAADDYKNLIT